MSCKKREAYSRPKVQVDSDPLKELFAENVSPSRKPTGILKSPLSNTIELGKYGYRPEDIIGDGYTSKVYKGFQLTNPNKRYAIKAIDIKKLNKDQVKLIENQILLHPQLDHENIVKCYEVIRTPRLIYVVLELCQQGDLSSYIEEMKTIGETKAIQMMDQIISAYRYLIQQGVLHRDLKPANILRCGQSLKIADFGFAVKGKKSLIDTMSVGTPLYMPPESIQQCFYSHKSDFFSLGCILYEMVKGKTPWFNNSQKVLVKNMKNQQIDIEGIKNFNIRDFILGTCQITEGNRMSIQEFMTFDLKKPFHSIMKLNIESQNPESKNVRSFLLHNSTRRSKHCTEQKNKSLRSNKSHLTLDSTIAPDSCYFKNAKSQEIRAISTDFEERFEFCLNLRYLLVNSEQSIILKDEMGKKSLIIVLFRHAIHVLKKMMTDFAKTKAYNTGQWDVFKNSKEFQNFETQCKALRQKMEKDYNLFLKGIGLSQLGEINKKFPEFSYAYPLQKKFYENLKEFLREKIFQFNKEIMKAEKYDNSNLPLSKGKNNSHYYEAFKSLYRYYEMNQEKLNILLSEGTSIKPKNKTMIYTNLGIMTAKHMSSTQPPIQIKQTNSAKKMLKISNFGVTSNALRPMPDNKFDNCSTLSKKKIANNDGSIQANYPDMCKQYEKSKMTHEEFTALKKKIKWLF